MRHHSPVLTAADLPPKHTTSELRQPTSVTDIPSSCQNLILWVIDFRFLLIFSPFLLYVLKMYHVEKNTSFFCHFDFMFFVSGHIITTIFHPCGYKLKSNYISYYILYPRMCLIYLKYLIAYLLGSMDTSASALYTCPACAGNPHLHDT